MKKKLLIMIMILLMALPAIVMATDYTLIWDANTEPVAGYRVYWGTEPGNYTNVTDVGLVTEYSITFADGQVWYVAITAYNASGLESDYSNEVNTQEPMNPGGLRFKPIARIVIEIPE